MQTIGISRAASAAHELAIDRQVGFAEQRAPLGVADDDVLGAGFADHRRAHFAREGALALPVTDSAPPIAMLLPRAASAAACTAVNGGATTMSTPRTSLDEAAQLVDVEDGLVHRLEHLPVAGDERLRAYGSSQVHVPS